MFGITMYGNSLGEQVLGIQQSPQGSSIIPNHPITTGIASFYEGITIAEVDVKQQLIPLIYGSNGKIVTAYYDMHSKRALVDGGFTRLYYKWDMINNNLGDKNRLTSENSSLIGKKKSSAHNSDVL